MVVLGGRGGAGRREVPLYWIIHEVLSHVGVVVKGLRFQEFHPEKNIVSSDPCVFTP